MFSMAWQWHNVALHGMKYFGAAWSDLRGRERREIMAWTGQEKKGKEWALRYYSS